MYRFVEAQVYDPRRDIISDRLGSTILADLGIELTQYKVRARTPKEPTEVANIVKLFTEAGALTADDSRSIASEVFNTELKDMPGIWSRLPVRLLIALLQTKNQLVASALLGEEGGDLLDKIQQALLSSGPAKPQVQDTGAQDNADEGGDIPSEGETPSGE